MNSMKEKHRPLGPWFNSEFWKKGKRIGLTGLAGSSKAYLLSFWRERTTGPLLIITPHLQHAEALLQDVQFQVASAKIEVLQHIA